MLQSKLPISRLRSLSLRHLNLNNLIYPLVVSSILLLALSLRIYRLDSESLWIDEAYSIRLALQPIPNLILGTANDQHPPLYYLILKAWSIYSVSVFHVRLLSVLLGTLNVAQAIHLGRLFKFPNLGLVTALFLAISPMHVWYSQEVRMYMLLAVLTTAMTANLGAKSHTWHSWLAYGALSTLALYTHNFAVFVLVAHGAFLVLLAIHHRHDWVDLRSWIVTMLGTALCYLPWLPTLLMQTQKHTMPWIGHPSIEQIRDALLQGLFNSARFNLPEVVKWIILGLTLVVFFYGSWRSLGKGLVGEVDFWLLLLTGLVTFILIASLSQLFPIFQYKQLLFLLLPLSMSLIWCLFTFPRWVTAVLVGLVTLSLASGLRIQMSQLTKDNWRGVANTIQHQIQSEDLLYTNPAAAELALGYYLQQKLPFDGYPTGYNIVSGGWNGTLTTETTVNSLFHSICDQYKRVWLVEYYPQFWDPDAHIEQWLSAHTSKLDDQKDGGIRTRLFRCLNSQEKK